MIYIYHQQYYFNECYDIIIMQLTQSQISTQTATESKGRSWKRRSYCWDKYIRNLWAELVVSQQRIRLRNLNLLYMPKLLEDEQRIRREAVSPLDSYVWHRGSVTAWHVWHVTLDDKWSIIVKELSQKLPLDDSYEGFSFTRSRPLDLDWSDEDRKSRMNNGSYGWGEGTWWD